MYVKGACSDSIRCSMSHSETWPRRNPALFKYDYKLCPNIQFLRTDNKMQLHGKCHYGRRCKFSHSKEEQLYHPDLYKTRMCLNYPNCKGYFCPFAHSKAEMRDRKDGSGNASKDKTPKAAEPEDQNVPAAVQAQPPLEETQYAPAEPKMKEMQSQMINEAWNSLYNTNYKNADYKFLDVNSLNSTVGSPNTVSTQEISANIDFDINASLEETLLAHEDVTDLEERNLRFLNAYFAQRVRNLDENQAAVSPTRTTAVLNKQPENMVCNNCDERDAEDDDEDGWLENVLQTGLQLLSEAADEPITRENTSAQSPCPLCERSQEMVKAFGRDVIEQWLPLDRLNITSITDPEIRLTNVPIPEKSFEHPSIPFTVVKSNIKSVVIRCPWKVMLQKDCNAALSIEVRDVDAVVRFKRIDEWGVDIVQNALISTRERLLRKWNAVASSLRLLSVKKGKRGSRAAAILNSLDITVNNVRIVLLDNLLYKEPFAITIEADFIRGVGMQHDDPSLSEDEQQAVADSLLNALWFTSSRVHMWLTVYSQGQDVTYTQQDLDVQDDIFDPQDWGERFTSQQPSEPVKPAPKRDASARKQEDATPDSVSSHSSDELFGSAQPETSPSVQADDDGTRLWNFCNAPCADLGPDYAGEYVEQRIKPEDEPLMRMLNGPYQTYNVTPPEGVAFDLVFKMWNIMSLSANPNARRQSRRNVQICISAPSDEGRMHAPCFDGETNFDPLDLTLTCTAADIIFNVVRYMQLNSAYREMASGDINAMPDVADCQRFIDVTRTSQWKHREEDAAFVKQFEKKVPFHILLKVKEMASSNQTMNVQQDTCFVSVPCFTAQQEEEADEFDEEEHMPSHDWYERESMLRIVFPNVNVYLAAVDPNQAVEWVPSTIVQLSTFAFQTEALYKRATYKILACKPIVRCGVMAVNVRKRTFSARVTMRPQKESENLLCYPEEMLVEPHEFFDNYGSDVVESRFHNAGKNTRDSLCVTIERYPNHIKHVSVIAPKLVLIFNTLMRLNSLITESFWKMQFFTFEVFVKRNLNFGHANTEFVEKLANHLEIVTSRTICKVEMEGFIVRTLMQKEAQMKYAAGADVEGTDQQSATQQHLNVLDLFLQNDNMLDKWDYCDDIDNPFAIRHAASNSHDHGSLPQVDDGQKMIYSKEKFLAELETTEPTIGSGRLYMLAPESTAMFPLSASLVAHLAELRRWYQNTCCVEMPQEFIEQLGTLRSLSLDAKQLVFSRESVSTLTCCTLETVTLNHVDQDGATTRLFTLDSLLVVKKENAICADVGKVDATLDPMLPIFTMLISHIPTFKFYSHAVQDLVAVVKVIVEAKQRYVIPPTKLAGNSEICKLISNDFYKGSPNVLEGCNTELVNAIEKKLVDVEGDTKILFLSVHSLNLNLLNEDRLYLFSIYKVRLEVKGRERFKFYVGNVSVCRDMEGSRQVILASKPLELGKEVQETMKEVNYGQVVIDYKQSDVSNVNMEVRDVHHIIDIPLVRRLIHIVESLKNAAHRSEDRENKNIVANVMVHHSSVNHEGLGAMIDVYLVANVARSETMQHLAVEIPRFHVTLTNGLAKRVLAMSLLDVEFEMELYRHMENIKAVRRDSDHTVEGGAKMINLLVEVSHCAVWGFQNVPEGVQLVTKFDNINDAAENLQNVLHEDWFNHMTTATLPSYYDNEPVVLVPLLSTRYAESARLMPMLNHNWITDWLLRASHTVEPQLCDKAVAAVLNAFQSDGIRNKKFRALKISVSTLICHGSTVSIGKIKIKSLTALMHKESIDNLKDIHSKLKLLKEEARNSNGKSDAAKVIKLNLIVDEINVACPYNTGINANSAFPSELLPKIPNDATLHRKRPRCQNSALYILRVHSSPMVYMELAVDTAVVVQNNITVPLVRTLYSDVRRLEQFTRQSLMDFVDVMEDAKYQALLHLYDATYNEGSAHIVSVSCDTLKASLHALTRSVCYWKDIVENVAAGTVPDDNMFKNKFMVFLNVDMRNLNVDICMASKSVYAAKLTLQHLVVTDAWGKHLVDDIYNSRCTLGNAGVLDDTTFCYQADQVNASLSTVDDGVEVKVALDHTRSEIQIDGIIVILGVLQDVGLSKLKKKDKSTKMQETKRPVRVELNLHLHEIWLYPSIPKTGSIFGESDPSRTVSATSEDTSLVTHVNSKITVPSVIKASSEVPYGLHLTALQSSGDLDRPLLYTGHVIGFLISISVSSQNKENANVKLKYMGVALARVSISHGVKVLVDEQNDSVFTSLNAEEGLLFEMRESSVKSKVTESGHLVVAVQASKPRISINIDQLFQMCLLKSAIVDTAVDTFKAYRKLHNGGTVTEDQGEDQSESYDLIEEIKYVTAKYNLPITNITDGEGSLYNVTPEEDVRKKLLSQARKKQRMIGKLINVINKLRWYDGDKQLTLSSVINDCRCTLFSVKNELVLKFNLQHMAFDLTHTAPLCKRQTIVDASMVFNVATYNANLNYHETVLQTTVATLQVACEDTVFDIPALDISMHISGVAVEVNPCLLQLFTQLKHVFTILHSDCRKNRGLRGRMIKLYNEIGMGIVLIGSRMSKDGDLDQMHLPAQTYTSVDDKAIYIFIEDAPTGENTGHLKRSITGRFEVLNGDVSKNRRPKWAIRERKQLLFGNSVNVKSLLSVIRGGKSTEDDEISALALSKAQDSLRFVGKYNMEQTGSRLFKVPNSDMLLLMEQYHEEGEEPHVILASSIRIQNSTAMPLVLRIDDKIGYFTRVAQKLTQHNKPKGQFEEMYLEPYTSSCVPLSWFGSTLMPSIALVMSNGDTTHSVPFQHLYDILNRNPFSDTEFESCNDVVLKFKGSLAMKCSITAKDVASNDDCGSCFYHFTVTLEPMVKIVNMLPCDIQILIKLHRTQLTEEHVENDEIALQALNTYKVQSLLKPGETLGIPFSEQKFFMRVNVKGTQLEVCNDDCKATANDIEYLSPLFQVFMPTSGTTSIVKSLKLYRGSIESLLQSAYQGQVDTCLDFTDHLKSMAITIDLSRHDIRIWWPFIFENMSQNSLLINGRLLLPKSRIYGNLHDASTCRIQAIMYTYKSGDWTKQGSYALSQSVKLDVTSTTDFRPPINLAIPLKNRTLSRIAFSETTNVEGILGNVVNASNIHHVKRYAPQKTLADGAESPTSEYLHQYASNVEEGDTTASGNAFVCLGSTVRYAEYPYNMCKIVSVSNMYTFVNKLPFTVCVRGAPLNDQYLDPPSDGECNDLLILPGDSGALNVPLQGAYIIKVENDLCSGLFTLQYPRLPHVFQLELNSNNITYSTVATRGLLIQVNVVSGVFEGSKMPYSYNGYYFVLSLPDKPQYQILNLTNYTLAYSVPENMRSVESQQVESYASYEQSWERTPMNKIGILPPTCITHYVPAAVSKSQEVLQVCLKVLHVDNCDWNVQRVDFVREGCHAIKFVEQRKTLFLYATIMIRSNGTRIIAVVNSKAAAMDLNRMGGSSLSAGPKLQWSSISFNFLTPRITVTLSTKRKVILALHLTNTSVTLSIAPSKYDAIEREVRGSMELESSRCSMVDFEANIQSIHIDHFVQGYIPVILKSSAKRSSMQESFLNIRMSLSNFMTLGLPIYETIQVKLSPLSINIEMAVIEQLVDSIENMLRLPLRNNASESTDGARNNCLVMPEPKLAVEPITLSLAIRTSSSQLTHRTMRILDALPLDTPCVCVHFTGETRSYLIVGWGELMHSLRHSYLRQLIRQSLPTAWLSNTFAVLYGFFKGLLLLVTRPVQTALKFKNALEGFAIGVGSGIMLFMLYITGGTTQSLGNFLNIFHKIIGGQRAKPQGILDALWLGLNLIILHVLYRPWKKVIVDLSSSDSADNNWVKKSVGLALNLAHCAISPIIGVVNMLITVVEGFSNLLLGDVEQFTHVYESDQLGKVPTNSPNPVRQNTERGESASSQTSFMRRMKTSVTLKRR
ncbi:amine-terminal region of A TM vesicle-mediated sorter [Babesia ovata]|uniref:Amine-terminal region of A TM vesicle-mediated sorter n=1 Tax=Babesia ovata TaxID=189622 RepID=A0A2H6KA18_9APIC|nr:amine-terminal region of A TM vesicle-mediated sorter [Babesia ovata]GBE59833.1 amine-terminal region of A TM vesicle-mediated sorter [Babesia ovata]